MAIDPEINRLRGEIERLKAENEELKEKLKGTKEAAVEGASDFNEANQKLREVLRPMRQLLVSLKENGSSHAFFIMQQAWGDLDWDEIVEMMDRLLEALKGDE